MPLPSVTKHGALQCKAKSKRSGVRCLNPAAYRCKTCRFHGARRPETIKRGAAHPGYKTGWETLQAKANRSRALTEMRELEALSFGLALATGPRWRGRKPKGS